MDESVAKPVAMLRNAAKKLDRTGRVTVNPRIRFAPAGLDSEIGLRHEFELRLD